VIVGFLRVRRSKDLSSTTASDTSNVSVSIGFTRDIHIYEDTNSFRAHKYVLDISKRSNSVGPESTVVAASVYPPEKPLDPHFLFVSSTITISAIYGRSPTLFFDLNQPQDQTNVNIKAVQFAAPFRSPAPSQISPSGMVDDEQVDGTNRSERIPHPYAHVNRSFRD
jgi:hypothetical protein